MTVTEANRGSGQIPPVVCFAGQDWEIHGRAHCDFQVMRELGRHRRVLVINSIGMRMPTSGVTERPWLRIRRKLVATVRYYIRRPLKDASPGLWVMTPISVPIFGTSLAARANTLLVAAQVWLAATALRLRRPRVLAIVPTSIDVIEKLGWKKIIYYRADDHAAASDVDHQFIKTLEDRLISASSHVLYTSSALREREMERSGDRSLFFDHGVELSHFRSDPDAVEPADLAAIPRPRVGFFGQIDSMSVDIPLVCALASRLPDVNVVMIGRSATDLSEAKDLPNLHLLGFRNYEQIPRYGQHFDVAIVPKPQSDWVKAVNPIKLKEYLALGLPIVATPCPDLDRFADRIAIAGTLDDFVAAVESALGTSDDGESARRRASVLADGWDVRAQTLVELMSEHAGD